MKKNPFSKGITLILIGATLLFVLTYASGEDKFKLQGKTMSLDLKKNMMVVNEGLFFWDKNTIISNDTGSPIAMDKFKVGSWVYIEAERDKVNKLNMIRTIYLLPKYIGNKERSRYPFME